MLRKVIIDNDTEQNVIMLKELQDKWPNGGPVLNIPFHKPMKSRSGYKRIGAGGGNSKTLIILD
jgi:hypothetical protein